MKNIITTLIILILAISIKAQNIVENELIKLDSSEKYNTLNELLSQYKGSVVYIDFWASWCPACLKELKHDAELDAFIEKNGIVRLYIAVERKTKNDKEKATSIKKWKNLVANNNLTGNNYYTQTHSIFMRDVYKNLMGKLSLPRFVIVDKNGNIAVKKAKRPSQKEQLIKQLNKQL